jgi:nicotinate-nucleotide--dimethylbenzimidazole phosphoribosyltransferase
MSRRPALATLAARVRPPGGALPEAVRAHLDALTKPPGSLGRLEDVAVRLAAVTGDPPPPLVHRVAFVLAGDHGVAGRGVSAYPAEVTAQMCRNIAAGGAAVCALARAVGCEVVVADLGVRHAGALGQGVLHARVRGGSGDLASEPAMTSGEVDRAIAAGAGLVAAREPAPDVVCLGEMGIGNSTAAAALTVLLTGCDPAEATGPGTGVAGPALAAKRAVVKAACARVGDGTDPAETLRQVGGLEIAGLVGVALEAAARRVPVIVDGFIATAAALVAVRIAPDSHAYLFAGHRSREPGHVRLLEALGLDPLLDLGLRLGEGTGAVLALPILDAAGAVLREMATFGEAGVSERVP